MSSTKAQPLLDLASLDTAAKAEAGFALELEHPASGAPLGITITLTGADSATYRRTQAALLRKKQGRRLGSTPDPDDVRRDACRLLAACTLAWTGVVLDGAELPCTAENAARLYQRFAWIFEQVDRAVHDRSLLLQD